MRYAILLDPRHPADRLVRSGRTFTKTVPVELTPEELTLEIAHEPWLKISEGQDEATAAPGKRRK